jgi:hypothetical protein
MACSPLARHFAIAIGMVVRQAQADCRQNSRFFTVLPHSAGGFLP